MILNFTNYNTGLARYSIAVEYQDNNENIKTKMFSPLTKNKNRAKEYVYNIMKRRGYERIKIRD